MKNFQINVMMFGGRRCGKTSIIAAMKTCFENEFGNTDLVISIPEIDTMFAIDEKNNEIKDYFNLSSHTFTPDDNPSEDLATYVFDIELKNKKTDKISLNFIDYPGEWLNNNKEKSKDLAKAMQECRIIMIAIDTPHLMERKGKDGIGVYNSRKNLCDKIGNMIKSNFKPNDDGCPNMIMFIPLKCEKYYNSNMMNEVRKSIREAYKNIFDYASGSNVNNYELVIAPILTFGENTVEFSRFEFDAEGVIIDETYKTPKKPIYTFVDNNNPYSPKHCEQPVLYSLAYVLNRVRKIKEQERKKDGMLKNLCTKFMEVFGNWASIEDFLDYENKIKHSLITNENGYEIISDPLELK